MSKSLSAQLLDATREAEALSVIRQDAQQEKRFSFLLSHAKSLRTLIEAMPASQDNRVEERTRREHREELRSYLMTCEETRTYSPLTEPSGLVPAAFFRELMLGIAQYSPILSADNIRLITLDNARPMTVPALDLSAVTAQVVGQGQDLAPTVNPVAGALTLNQFTYRCNPVAASLELEQDSFESIGEILTQAFSVGMARGIGADLINGNGTTAPLGLLNAAADSGITTASATAITSDEIADIFFSVNRAYRASPKCAWVMSDTMYQIVRKAVDQNLRPLINMVDDREVLMGKKIVIAPDMPSDAGSKAIVFGDLSQYICRVNRASVRVTRSLQAAGYAEFGIALYTAWLSLDAKLNTVNDTEPVVYATLAS